MSFLRPLDDALSSTSKVRVLRLLVQQDRTVSAREAARLTGMSLPPILAAINDLATLGLITREESGNQFLCRVNREHRLYRTALKDLFAAESRWADMVFSAIRTALAPARRSRAVAEPGSSDVLVAWVFGSAARGKDRPGSDLDLFVITATEAAAERAMDRLAESVAGWRTEFGTDVRPVVMGRARALSERRQGNPLLTNAIEDPRVVLGTIPAELLHG